MTSEQHAFTQAVALLQQGKVSQGIELLKPLTHNSEFAEKALQILFKVAMQQQDTETAIAYCQQLVSIAHTKFDYVLTLVQLSMSCGEFKIAKNALLPLYTANPQQADICFQLGKIERKLGNFDAGISFFERAIKLSEQFKAPALIEIAFLYNEQLHQPDKALHYLQQAISHDKNNLQAHFSLANIYEQLGDKEKAKTGFQQVLKLDAFNAMAQARLADIETFSERDAIDYEQASLAILKRESDDIACADIYYALGKVFNDCKNYQKAWHYYVKANHYNKKYLPVYDRQSAEKITDYTLARNIALPEANSSITPIIICGMFRSGSTLIEQIISSNEQIAAGGEIAYLHSSLFSLIGDEKALVNKAKEPEFIDGYKEQLTLRAEGALYVTDKRPENYLYLDIIKQLYPKAKIIWTERDIKDNSLSAFFQHLGPSLNYAVSLNDTLHHYEQQQRIKSHWQSCFSNDIFTLNYDQLVCSPEQMLEQLFSFLGLEYTDEAQRFHNKSGAVSTASVWQVRKPLYKSSSGRFANYLEYIQADEKSYLDAKALLNK
ncbi:tetratricopeptide repeat-containing sulfotransferase family protein [uncultured Pseudoalteromonas sp.]|uniref:tetratricopeptide repeat-containing sulfotransferase family protein n=1 Tax=Pseudoalteromonas sp. DY56-GL22 TaxID=2967126 RepID=UPI0026020DBE|nr:tetratricopeptide repeat-containing sulfotransferase family protein [uncultured Pseudoalteromonas sp.]MED5511462.1 sulfotransferase [Pseudomonadota bacterium]